MQSKAQKIMIIKQPFHAYQQKKNFINPSSFKGRDVKTPKHFYHKFRFGFGKDTYAMSIGRAIHTFILEPEIFKNEYALMTSDMFGSFVSTASGYPNLRNAENKKIFEDFCSLHYDKKVLTPEQSDYVNGMANGLQEDIRDLNFILNLKTGNVERSIYLLAEFDEYGKFLQLHSFSEEEIKSLSPENKAKFLPVKTRPDYDHEIKRYAADLKTTKDASPDGFPKEALEYGYHMQAPFILDCLNCEFKTNEFDTFIFIVVENEAPFAAIKYNASQRMIESGREDYKNRLQWIFNCFKSKYFKGYDIFSDYMEFDEQGKEVANRQMIELDLPDWYYTNRERKRNFNKVQF